MRTAILFFGLVAMCQGLSLEEGETSELLDLLRNNIPTLKGRTHRQMGAMFEGDNPIVESKNPMFDGDNPLLNDGNPMADGNAMLGVGNTMLGVDNPMLGVDNPRLGVDNPRLGVDNPMIGVNNPRLGVDNPMLGVNTPRLGIGNPMLGVGNPMGGGSPFNSNSMFGGSLNPMFEGNSMFDGNTMTPPEVDPRNFDIDTLFQFPGSNYIMRMLIANFSDPTPLYADRMQDFPEDWPQLMDMYVKMLEPRWWATLSMFRGDYTGLPEFYTRMFTKWVAHFRFACPSTYFDKIFARWSFNHLVDSFHGQDVSMFEFIRSKLVELFPTYDETRVGAIAQEGVIATHHWIVEEMMQHIFGYGFKDVGVFSHKLYQNFMHHFRSVDTTAFHPGMSRGSLRDIVKSALYDSNVRCHSGMEVQERYGKAIGIFKRRSEEMTVEYIATKVSSLLIGHVEITERATTTLDKVIVDAIAGRIRAYVDVILSDIAVIEESFTTNTPNTVPLQQLMENTLSPDETGLISDMFSRLGFQNTGTFDTMGGPRVIYK